MSCKRAAIIIPTLNEKDSIGPLVEALCTRIFPALPQWDCSVVVVDGNSADGTAALIQARQATYPNLKLIREDQPTGLGAAYAKGFEYAIRALQADVVVECDGDLQHPPETIPALLAPLDAGCDYVLGSRLVRGGSFSPQLGLARKFLSRLGGLFIRAVLFFPSPAFYRLTDPTTGLRALKVAGFAEHIDFAALRGKGFSYKLILLHRMIKLGARLTEIPLNFQPRITGASKLTARAVWEMLHVIFSLRWQDLASRNGNAPASLTPPSQSPGLKQPGR
jgi:dolichol-phosphate mannosyltransferase